ncbi:MAG: efflux RND transporter periplasmic adaptor subunit [Bacteroidales bacterium]|jgi:Cu(I)/Ag(I) efflux system membrane fusion protein|nr:efflux RND transporter periplasmic adaptor subunit [Bacteroidales bacterium]
MKKHYILYGLILIAGIFLGWMIFGGHSHDTEQQTGQAKSAQWTCSMHPQIRQDHFGTCPLCGMDLIPVGTGDSYAEDVIHLSKEAIALANVQTTVVSRAQPVKEVHLYGIVQPNERLSQLQVSHIGGRIEKLYINSVGENVRKGELIASIYSPELLNAQKELLEALKMQPVQPALIDAVKEKLRQWKMTEAQISSIERTATVSPTINIVADKSGVVTAKKVEQGDYVSQGSVLFDLSDLSSVWLVFDVYEADLPYLKIGDLVTYTLQALPEKTFTGRLSLIEPVLDKTTRTAKVRVEAANPQGLLKPEMYAQAIVSAKLISRKNEIVIPKTAILWTGRRSIVYVKQSDESSFQLREITLGASLGDAYVVLSGLSEGEEIVTDGVFAMDASAQLEGKASMMNRPPVAEATQDAVLTVQGLCGMCKTRIETAAKSVKGVMSAVWNSQTKELNLTYDKTSGEVPDQAAKAIAKVGHDNNSYKAPDDVYNALPGCCKYR